VVGRRNLGIRNHEEITMAATILSHRLFAPPCRVHLVFFRQTSFMATPQATPKEENTDEAVEIMAEIDRLMCPTPFLLAGLPHWRGRVAIVTIECV
jgi:hypothetical protein